MEEVTNEKQAPCYQSVRGLRQAQISGDRGGGVQKCGGGIKVSLEEAGRLAGKPDEDLLEVDEGLSKFEDVDPRAAKVVELKFFSGLTDKEAAEVMGVPLISARRDWEFATVRLFDRLTVAPAQ